MAVDTVEELESFHRFIADQLENGGAKPSPEECLRLWRAAQQERAETLAAIAEGLNDISAGRVKPLDDFDREFRTKHGIPQDA
ncbi:MAG: hypothetical protein HY000_28650 [Planctomycetes bacterium]|nr:hypothetical protein [Planctomycetota bacterium]